MMSETQTHREVTEEKSSSTDEGYLEIEANDIPLNMSLHAHTVRVARPGACLPYELTLIMVHYRVDPQDSDPWRTSVAASRASVCGTASTCTLEGKDEGAS